MMLDVSAAKCGATRDDRNPGIRPDMKFLDNQPIRGQWRRKPRGWQSPIAQRSLLFEGVVVIAYISLLYKLVAVGLLMLIILAVVFPFIQSRNWQVSWPAAGSSIAYVAMSTVTAVFVDKIQGLERTVQGVIAIGAAATLIKYFHLLTEEERIKVLKAFTVLNLMILANVIIYHVTHHHIVTWKYLFDTKFVFAVLIALLFYWEDDIKAWSIALWWCLLPGCVLIVLVSGERKAYLTFVVCYLLSRARWSTILTIGTTGLGAAALYAVAVPESYVTRQLESPFVHTEETPTPYFFTVSALADQSDLVRTFVNRNARRLFWKHPLFGLGATGYQHWAIQTYGDLIYSRGLSMNVHGERNRVPVENGLVGIAIALSFLTICATRMGRHWRANGGTEAPSRIRGPAYLYVVMLFYIYSEAQDTTMLILILTVGFTAGSLHFGADGSLLRGDRNHLGALRNRARMVDGRRRLIGATEFGSRRPER